MYSKRIGPCVHARAASNAARQWRSFVGRDRANPVDVAELPSDLASESLLPPRAQGQSQPEARGALIGIVAVPQAGDGAEAMRTQQRRGLVVLLDRILA